MTTLGRGVKKEIRLAIRALKTARTHLSNSRCGLAGEVDAKVLGVLMALEFRRQDLTALLSKPSRSARKVAACG
jgi:hypothetical protein